MKHIAILLGSVFLIVLAVFTVALITIPAFIWKIIVSFKHENRNIGEILSGMATYFVSIASSIDKFGNAAFGGFLNSTLLLDQKYRFGHNSETVSEVLGWAYKLNDLNETGLMLRAVVNWIDFTVKDHCEAARLEGIDRAKLKLSI